MGKKAATVHVVPSESKGPVASCKACGRAAMVPASLDALEDALDYDGLWARTECAMECAYCGAKATVSGVTYLDHALFHGDGVRAYWQRNLADERAKVARLAEGRW